MSHITAIVPAYNEESTIGSVVIGTREFVDHVIVVDDGSSDHTAEIAGKAGATVIKHPHNIGKGAALKTGFKAVSNSDIVVTVDGDGQHNPWEIPFLVKPIEDGVADLVNGSRYLNRKGRKTPAYRRLGQTVLDKTININSGLNITDSQSGFRAFSASTIHSFQFTKADFSIESEMLMDASASNFKIVEVPVGVNYSQKNGKGKIHTQNPVSHGIGVFMKLLQDMEFRRPLYYFTIPGVVLIFIGLALGLLFFGQYLDGQMTTLMPTVLAGMIGLGGIFVAFTGIILHTVSGMLRHLRK